MSTWTEVARAAALCDLLTMIAGAARWDAIDERSGVPMKRGSIAGLGAYSCDGHGALIVIGGTADVERERDSQLLRVLQEPKTRAMSIPAGVLRRSLASGGEFARVGQVLMQARLVRRWVLAPAEVSGGDVTVAWGRPREAVRFSGSGWQSVVMAYAPHPDKLASAAPIDGPGESLVWCSL
jgi:hypothetical protein